MQIETTKIKESDSRVLQVYVGEHMATRVRRLARKYNVNLSEIGRAAFKAVLKADDEGKLNIKEV